MLASGMRPTSVRLIPESRMQELAKAKALVAKGTPKNKVYETIIAKGETGPKTAR